MRLIAIFLSLIFISNAGISQRNKNVSNTGSGGRDKKVMLQLVQKDTVISVFRTGEKDPILTQVAKVDNRAYIHPIIAPDGKGVITQYRPSHHKHQTGIYWGLKLVNGRDFFMNWRPEYYKRVSFSIVTPKGPEVKWQVVDNLLDENGNAVLTETHNWTMQEVNGKYILDLLWQGKANTDITFGKFYVGGLFVRMPWEKGIDGDIITATGLKNSAEAEAQRAIWADVGMKIEGREDKAHIAIFDYPKNATFPTAWRVDSQLGLGPSRQILGDWKLAKGETETFRFRLIIYTGDFNSAELTDEWIQFIKAF